MALLADGGEIPYDLFLGVPVHRAPEVVVASGLTIRQGLLKTVDQKLHYIRQDAQ